MITPTWHPERSDLRVFGIVAFFAFGLLGAVLRWQFDLPVAGGIVWAVGGIAGVTGLISPYHVYPLFLLVTLIALPIGLVVSNLVLGVIYFGIMTPLGWVMRLRGRDPLRLKRPNADSFWIPRERRSDASSYYRQS